MSDEKYFDFLFKVEAMCQAELNFKPCDGVNM